ncbi:MAG: 50S ribosomal protein L18e [Candidatus Heimdallarchaeota archaeon]|nr:50S ribosomal protein L18e [Candidatus Heimdallarchaeota archaeon]MCK4877373.1 50S ribosomal protein L18e [Candidatus Heimdallarchaeota archaeon]
MPKRTGTTDPNLVNLINNLKKKSAETKTALWKTVAERLEKSRRQRATTNLSKINRHTKANDIVVVPGSVLSSGSLDHSVTIAALKFSEGAKEKIQAASSKFISIQELVDSKHAAKKIKIII